MTIRHSGGIPFWSFKTKNSIFPVSGRFKPDNLKTFHPPTDRGNPNQSSTEKVLSFRVDISFYLRSFHPTSESGSRQVQHGPGQITPGWGPLTIDLSFISLDSVSPGEKPLPLNPESLACLRRNRRHSPASLIVSEILRPRAR